MAPKAQNESKRGLTVALVFFILSTIGAGIAAYYGFSEQEAYKNAANKAKVDVAEANRDRDAYRYYVAMARLYLGFPAEKGTPVERELADKAKYDGNDQSKRVKDEKENADLKDLVAKLAVLSDWDANALAPKQTLKQLIDAKAAELAPIKKARDDAETAKNVALAAQTAAEKKLEQAEIDYKAAIAKLSTDFKADRDKYDTTIKTLTAKLNEAENTKDEKFIQPIVKRNEQLEADNKSLLKRIKDVEDKLVQVASAAPSASADAVTEKPSDPTPRGKIVRVHLNPRKATIDLGKVHGLTPQTTFAVHGYQTSGKPRVRSKANIEVINVGPSTSEVLITEVFHPNPDTDHVSTNKRKVIDVLDRDNTDPIVPGDALINPLWNPNAKTHIAIAGFIDLDGSGAINMASLVQILEKQNVIVDAYIDPLDGSLKGKGLSRRTDYLLLGGKLTGASGAPKDEATIKEFDKNHDKLIQDAKLNAIPQKQPHAFFRETGFNLPKTVTID